MKTAISVPDVIFAEAAKRAVEMGVSRSEFFSTAARSYLDELSPTSLVAEIDHALHSAGDDDSLSVAVAVGRQQLQVGDDW